MRVALEKASAAAEDDPLCIDGDLEVQASCGRMGEGHRVIGHEQACDAQVRHLGAGQGDFRGAVAGEFADGLG